MTLPLLRPVLRRGTATAWSTEARPAPPGPPVATIEGPDPDRVLVIGSGPVSGAGMAGHGEALPGTVARALHGRTGHGAVVEARGRRQVRLADLPELLAGAQLRRFDALVLVVGLFDATDGIGGRAWTKALHGHLDSLQRDGARDAVVLLTRIPPFSSVAQRRGVAAVLADRNIARLNAEIERTARTRPSTGCAALPPPAPDAPLGTAGWYGRCGEAIADALTPMLAAQRSR